MKSSLVIVILYISNVSGLPLNAAEERVAEELDQLRASYQREVQMAMKRADESYIAALEAEFKRHTKAGKLEAAMQVRNEIAFMRFGGVWRWNGGTQRGYLSIQRDRTAIDIIAKIRGTWESTEKGLKISWENKSWWELQLPTARRKAFVKASNGSTLEIDRE